MYPCNTMAVLASLWVCKRGASPWFGSTVWAVHRSVLMGKELGFVV